MKKTTSLLISLCFLVLLFTGCEKQKEVDKTELHLYSAESYINQGQFRSAIIEIKNALQKKPGNAEAVHLMARVMLEIGDGAGAERQVKELIKADPDNPGYRLELARALLLQNKFNTAVLELNEIPQPEDTGLAFQYQIILGKAHLGARSPGKAKNAFETAASIQSDSAQPHVGLAKVAFLQGNREEVESQTQKALELNQDEVDVWVWGATWEMQKKNFDQAEHYFSEALGQMSSQDIMTATRYNALNGIIKSLIEQGRPGDATIFQKQLKNSPQGQVQTEFQKALASFEEGNVSDAEATFEQILKENPYHGLTGTAMGMLSYSKGDLEEAEKYLEKALAGGTVPLQAHKLLAATQMKLGKIDNAITILDNALVEHPEEDQLWALKGAALMSTDQTGKALQALEKSLELNPNNIGALVSMGGHYQRQEQFPKSLQMFEKVLEVAPNNPLALRGIIASHKAQGDMDKGMTKVKAMAEQHPKLSAPPMVAAAAHLSRGELDAAKPWAERAHKRAPDSPQARNLLSGIYYESSRRAGSQKQWRKARELAEKGLELSPDSVQLTRLLVNIEMLQDRFNEALGWIQKLQRERPDNALPFEMEGDLFMVKSRVSEAVSSYKTAFGKEKSQRLALKLFRALDNTSSTEQALQPIQQWQESDPDNPYAGLSMAMAYQQAKRPEAAIKEYERLKEKYPENALVLNNLAWLYFESDNPEAVALAGKAYELAPENPAIADTYGWILVKKNEHEQGLEILTKAAELAPGHPEITEHYAVALEMNGQSEKAREVRAQLEQ